MWIADNWKDYKVLDTTSGEKLERWGKYVLLRPDPQVIWKTKRSNSNYKKLSGHYHRSAKGGGDWENFNMPDRWQINYEIGRDMNDSYPLTFNLQPFKFKHTGVFPEQAVNWEWFYKLIKESKRKDIKVLNLFAYTGGATLSALAAGAHVTHVDASKGMVNWAKENAKSSKLDDRPVRWLVDDCTKFVEREIRRGNKYDAIILDPPSYGRGPKGEIWKMEDNIYDFLRLLSQVLSDEPLFFLLNSYTTGLQSSVLSHLLSVTICDSVMNNKDFKGNKAPVVIADEIGLPIEDNGLVLPCGASGRIIF